ncbi:MAG TPA: pyridoxamine 5'-phosphate oxidase family protein [Candidatus Methylacidiphilales bacterium]|nr:pyridoxamine 5'-phosphate oxidase family protein [Candidatus Methylacidiphilales bacterium]
MHRRLIPTITFRPAKEENLSVTDIDFIVRLARKLADGSRPGVLTTVDVSGRPQARWMPTVGFNPFPLLYAWSSSESREAEALKRKPFVNWMFGNDLRGPVVNFTGPARVVTEAVIINQLWKLRAQQACLPSASRRDTGFRLILIETRVDNIECNISREQFEAWARFTVQPSFWSSCGITESETR